MKKRLKINRMYISIGILILITILSISIGATLMKPQNPQLQSVPSNTFSQLIAQESDYVLIDIRTPAEYTQEHLPGAINLDYYSPTFSAQLDQLDKSKTYIIYCRSGSRSKGALQLMDELGFTRVFELSEGILKCC